MSRDMTGWTETRNAWASGMAVASATGPDDGVFTNGMHIAKDGGRGKDTEDADQANLVREILGTRSGEAR